MNWMLLTAGAIASLTCIGHFTVGYQKYLKPLLESNLHPIPKTTLHCVFHYVSAFLLLSSITLISVGSGYLPAGEAKMMILFIAVNYMIFAIWQVIIAFQSGIPNAPFKLFQWVFFVLIALFAWLGSLVS